MDAELTPEELELLQASEMHDPCSGRRSMDEIDAGEWVHGRQDPIELRRQLDVLESFHQDVANRFADSLSRGLQRLVEVELASVQPLSYSQFAFSRANPTCYAVLKAHPLPAPLALDLSPQLLYPLLDCLLGGGKHPCAIPQRAPTELEQRLARRVIRMLLDELHDAWEPLLAVDLSIERLESHAQRVRVVAPADAIVSLTFRVRVAEQSGELTFGLPLRAIRKIVDKLLVGEFHGVDGSTHVGASDEETLELVAFFEAESISATELDQLRPGDVLLSEIDADGLVQVAVNGEPKLQARPGALHGKRAIAIV
jgi:flagellar motor switch protein FliM